MLRARKEDRFEFVRELQKGGQGEVHVCRRVSTGNEYAVKIIHSRAIKRHPEHELFLRREIRCLRELQHRNIVNLIAAFWEAGTDSLEPIFGAGKRQVHAPAPGDPPRLT
ncbi:Calcium/calmodulin-dependent protein kinase type II delta 1 chain [Symbiodinium microadriaticum]|uniref:Calcium/calmodulin-dependent protein kinase type II delta 1 chain n=1 Tax=Symbiodinium microadriaticum TaxID=2951 RepID=A0A1Q9DM72_SYMMI|nr:Calcium/calmodulin-dependent protein kinase type II delta 1 chain [Symbiodinium microadriaticum]